MFKMDLESIKSKFVDSDNEVLKNGIEEIDSLSKYISKLGYNDICGKLVCRHMLFCRYIQYIVLEDV